MKKIVLSVALLVTITLVYGQAPVTDRQQIEQTIQRYFDGWATGDTNLLKSAMHPSCQLKNYQGGQFTLYTRAQYIALFKPHPRSPYLKTRIAAIDLTNNMAAAKVEINPGKVLFTDYFNLIKTNEGWLIADKVSTRTPIMLTDDDLDANRKVDSILSVYTSATPGAAIAIVKEGKIIFSNGYGMADLNHHIPITPQTVFNIASVSKQFTAFAIYLLSAEGRIQLDDDIRKYISELPDYGKVIKVRHLLAHTSGLRDQAALGALAGGLPGDVNTTGQTLKLISRQKHLNFTPGTAFGYCNTGYTLLAEIVHRVTGTSFAAYCQQKIFEPLGMTNTRFDENYQSVINNKASSYERSGEAYYQQPLSVSNPGPSNLLTTVEDLAKWVNNFEQPIVGTPQLIAAFNEPSYLDNGQKAILRATPDGDTVFHAKGQNLWHYRGAAVLSHGGHAAAFRTFIGRFPQQRLAIILLSNDEHNERLPVRWQLADYYIPDQLLPPDPATTNTPPAKAIAPLPPAGKLDRFAGDYYSEELQAHYMINEREGKLVMTHLRQSDIPLSKTGTYTFTGAGNEVFPFEIIFQLNTKKAVSGFTISNFGAKNVQFVKVK